MFSAHLKRRLDLDSALSELNGFLERQVSESRLGQHASIVVEELIVNAFLHGAAEHTGGVGVELRFEGSILRGAVSYDGEGFDPSDATNLEEGQNSGRGLHLIQSLTNSLVYSRHGNENRVRFEIASDWSTLTGPA